jgi:glyoxylase-like metal-dependent hydrolase (beta-lactamase superfamily II)
VTSTPHRELVGPVTGVPEVSAREFDVSIRGRNEVLVLDTRSPAAFAAWHVEPLQGSVVNVSEVDVRGQVGKVAHLAKEATPLYVICTAGNASRRVVGFLRERGVDAVSVRGGMAAWSALLQKDIVPLEGGLEVLQFRREGRGCLSYLVMSAGEALVVDPIRDPQPYLDAATRHAVRIAHVVDTHLHADHISGARAVADQTGAALHLSEMALSRGVRYADRVDALVDGDTLAVGSREVAVVSLPGHTTEMTGLLLGKEALLSGDSLFVDSVARPDLEHGDEGAAPAARQLHRTLQERVAHLPDSMLLLPGHYRSGRQAGPIVARLGAVRERIPELALSEDAFVASILDSLPPKPENYAAIIAINVGEDTAVAEAAGLEVGTNNCAAASERLRGL